MRQMMVIAWHDIRAWLHKRETWLLAVLLPAMVMYLVGLGAQGFARRLQVTVRMDVVDEDGTAASRAFVAALAEASPALIVCPARGGGGAACASAESMPSVVLTIPVGLATALDTGRPVTLSLVSPVAAAPSEIAFWAVRQAAARAAAPVVAARLSVGLVESLGVETGPDFFATRLDEATAAWGPPPPVRVQTVPKEMSRRHLLGAQILRNGFVLSTPGITAMFVMVTLLGMSHGLAEERMWGVLRRLILLPIGRGQLLAGKAASLFVMGLVQASVLLGFGCWLGVDFGQDVWAVLLVVVAYVAAVCGLSLSVGVVATNPRQASSLATGVWLVLVPLGGGWWPLAYVPHWLAVAGHVSPVAWFLDALSALMLYEGTLADVVGPVAVLLAFALAFFALAVRRLRV